MSNKKKGQHHVWRYYLTPWAVEEKIWTLINASKIIKQDTHDVGKKRYIYKVVPPTIEEHLLAKKFYGVESMDSTFKELAEGWIRPFELLYHANELKENGHIKDNSLIDEIETMIINAEEDIHSGFESNAVKYFVLMGSGNFTFLDEEKSRIFFSYFTSLQFFRTSRNKNAMLNALTHKNVREALDKTWNYGKFILSNTFAFNLYNGKIQVLSNKTDIPFITSDQPVVNLDAKLTNDGTPPETMRLYYPISPKVALCFEKGDKVTEYKDVDDYHEVEKFNDFMFNMSEIHTFSNYEIMLKKYLEEQ